MTFRSGRALAVVLAIVAAAGGALVAVHYHRLGLTLSHYDARGHLVVARRIVDSITPGWQQVGAVWLPLPHLLNLVPVQVDWLYRSGASAVGVSVLSFGVAVAAIGWSVHAITRSTAASIAAAAAFAFNPNVLYLQATPMTEPLLLALVTAAVALLAAWCETDLRARLTGIVLALACMTRYEAWPVTICALGAAAFVRWRRGEAIPMVMGRVARVAIYPAVAVALFLIFSRVVIGEWFVAGGFFVPENKALGSPLTAFEEIWWGVEQLSGTFMTMAGAAGIAILFLASIVRRRNATALVILTMAATAAVPWAAFVKGHPFRIRYMVPLLAVEAVGIGVAVALAELAERKLIPRSAGVLSVLAVLAIFGYELRPVDARAPMVVEAQWDRPNVPVRARVTECLGRPAAGKKIMASMGSLGHYMQETARAGFAIRDFLHEGNGDIWLAALAEGPRRFADWVLIEEKAEGGDMLAQQVREHPHFLDGYSRVCEGAGVALYRRDAEIAAATVVKGERGQNLMLSVKR